MNVSDTSTATITVNDQHGLVGGASGSPKPSTEVPPEMTGNKECSKPHMIEGNHNIVTDNGTFNDTTEMSTEDFLVLHTAAQEEPYKVLDEVIARMKENMEEVGDAMEALVKMSKETSEDSVALQLLQKSMDQNE